MIHDSKYSKGNCACKIQCIRYSQLVYMENSIEMEDDEDLSVYKLMKLLYYAEGCFLAFHDKSLFSDDILAIPHDLSIESVYEKFKEESYRLDYDITVVQKILQDTEVVDLLEQVYKFFGEYSNWGLKRKVRREVPWLNATNKKESYNGKMSRDDMKHYFKENYIEE